MSGKDPDRQWIDRNVNSPVVSYDWAASERDLLLGYDTNGMIEEWRKVVEIIRRRRGKQVVGSNLYNACEEAMGLCKYITMAGTHGAIQGDWKPSHEILRHVAMMYELRTGRIDPLIQAVVRDAMDEAFTSERFGQ